MSIPAKHKKGAPKNIPFAVVVVSDSRYEELKSGKESSDRSTPIMVQLLTDAGHKVESIECVPDSKAHILRVVEELLGIPVPAIITTGGTGLSPRDVTVESIEPLLEKKIPGFGELLRQISFKEIGAATILTRAIAGIIKETVIFCLPGSPDAARLALEQLIIPEIGHIMKHLKEKRI
ncbi:MAG: molybdenum cofactor biosynthesis protein B [Promethearchaeota archaeon]